MKASTLLMSSITIAIFTATTSGCAGYLAANGIGLQKQEKIWAQHRAAASGSMRAPRGLEMPATCTDAAARADAQYLATHGVDPKTGEIIIGTSFTIGARGNWYMSTHGDAVLVCPDSELHQASWLPMHGSFVFADQANGAALSAIAFVKGNSSHFTGPDILDGVNFAHTESASEVSAENARRAEDIAYCIGTSNFSSAKSAIAGWFGVASAALSVTPAYRNSVNSCIYTVHMPNGSLELFAVSFRGGYALAQRMYAGGW